eukprot:gene49491-64637_t
MELYAYVGGSAAERSEQCRGCLGLVLTAVNGEQQCTPRDAVTAMHEGTAARLHFRARSQQQQQGTQKKQRKVVVQLE